MKLRFVALLAPMLLSACVQRGDVFEGGVYAVRSACPIAGVPAGTGDITLFDPPSSRDSRAIDVTAFISDVRATCQDAGSDIVSTATFTVVGLRRDAGPARQVVLPYFNVALQGGGRIAAKQIGQAVLNFPAGGQHSWTRVQGTIRVNRAAATLPENVRRILTRPRKAGEAEAAVDPLSDPGTRAAVASATFEHLVGFQLTQDQLKYNATR
ncbi:MAG TPA: hypothetical protein VFY95_10830 [Sphingomicrobium sp.]